MSATNPKTRGGGGYDDFPTPPWCVQRLLEARPFKGERWRALDPGSGDSAGSWLEPCAGAGNIIGAVNDFWRKHDGYDGVTGPEWTACEIQDRYRDPLLRHGAKVSTSDFLTCPWWNQQGHRVAITDPPYSIASPRYTVAITNPPYGIAFEVLKRCRELAAWTIMLLPLMFLEGGSGPKTRERGAFLDQDMPNVLILPNRPPFAVSPKTGRVGTDRMAYFWGVWGPERTPVGYTTRLRATLKEIRKAWTKKLNAEAAA